MDHAFKVQMRKVLVFNSLKLQHVHTYTVFTKYLYKFKKTVRKFQTLKYCYVSNIIRQFFSPLCRLCCINTFHCEKDFCVIVIALVAFSTLIITKICMLPTRSFSYSVSFYYL